MAADNRRGSTAGRAVPARVAGRSTRTAWRSTSTRWRTRTSKAVAYIPGPAEHLDRRNVRPGSGRLGRGAHCARSRRSVGSGAAAGPARPTTSTFRQPAADARQRSRRTLSGAGCCSFVPARRPDRHPPALDLRDELSVVRPEEMGEARLRSQPLLDRPRLRHVVRQPVPPVDDLVQRPEAGLDREPTDHRAPAAPRAPAERAVAEHVQERRTVGARALPPSRSGRARTRRPPARRTGSVGDGDRRHVLAPLRLAEALEAGGARGRARAERGRAGALDPRVHVRLVVVADEDEAVAALERARERLRPMSYVPPSPAKTTNVSSSVSAPRLRSAR